MLDSPVTDLIIHIRRDRRRGVRAGEGRARTRVKKTKKKHS